MLSPCHVRRTKELSVQLGSLRIKVRFSHDWLSDGVLIASRPLCFRDPKLDQMREVGP